MIEPTPEQLVTLPGLTIVRFAGPALHHDEEIHSLIIAAAMHDVGDPQFGRIDLDAGLLAGFAKRRLGHRLPGLDVAGHDAVVAVLVARVEAPQQQDLVCASEEDVHGHRVGVAHGAINFEGSRRCSVR